MSSGAGGEDGHVFVGGGERRRIYSFVAEAGASTSHPLGDPQELAATISLVKRGRRTATRLRDYGFTSSQPGEGAEVLHRRHFCRSGGNAVMKRHCELAVSLATSLFRFSPLREGGSALVLGSLTDACDFCLQTRQALNKTCFCFPTDSTLSSWRELSKRRIDNVPTFQIMNSIRFRVEVPFPLAPMSIKSRVNMIRKCH